jgi:hypothetical protein
VALFKRSETFADLMGFILACNQAGFGPRPAVPCATHARLTLCRPTRQSRASAACRRPRAPHLHRLLLRFSQASRPSPPPRSSVAEPMPLLMLMRAQSCRTA